MIDRQSLLADLQEVLPALETDLRERVRDVPELDTRLRTEYQEAREAGRTAQAHEEWREEPITQAAVAWILGCVFVRFMEDNGLVKTPRLSGPGERLNLARDHHTVFFQKHPSETDREYLLDVFRDVATLPAARELFDERHNPLWSLGLSGDGARKLLEFWQQIDPESGALIHDFTDPEWNTRFLGDLYQDLSEAARKKYALLQTPEFVEEFILDRTLDPAVEEFGYREVRLIDVTCGSGHFLLGGFRKLFELWLRHEPGTNARELAQRALDGVYGVDLNPFAVAIARFRLLTAALKASGVTRLKDAPGFRIHLAVGDSLLHGKRWQVRTSRTSDIATERPLFGLDRLEHVYASEDGVALSEILGRQYHAVVGNPPYITVRDDTALNGAYRRNYGSCHMKYSLAVPFMERFFELALPGTNGAGFVGMITANSFMKREFGKKLIEDFIPHWDLTHIVDTSGAYIPGHATSTVLLFGRNRVPVLPTVRAVMGIRGEPTTPDDPGRGVVWLAIVDQVDRSGSSSDWVSVSDTPRANFHRHPWTLGGGGAAELKEILDARGDQTLGGVSESIGFMAITGEDDFFLAGRAFLDRVGLPRRPFVFGEGIRDWTAEAAGDAFFPYDEGSAFVAREFSVVTTAGRFLWCFRASLSGRSMFGKSPEEHGLKWYEYLQFIRSRMAAKHLIPFAFVSTHNHFGLNRGGKVFNRTAPVIKMRDGATEDEHLTLLGLLNSSTICFWLKQVCSCKGLGGQGGGIKPEDWHRAYEFDAGKVGAAPVVSTPAIANLARRLSEAASTTLANTPANVDLAVPLLRSQLVAARQRWIAAVRKMVALQEELDWQVYAAFGLAPAAEPCEELLEEGLHPEDRPAEQLLKRRMAGGESSIYYTVHGDRGLPRPSLSERWSSVMSDRLARIEADPRLGLLETPNHKRRWEVEPWEEQQQRALRQWLLGRLESPTYRPDADVTTLARLADRAQADPEFMHVATLYRERADFDVAELVAELVAAEAIPFLPVLRYKETGLRKRALWERTWELQRREDRAEAVREIPVPPKYTSADFKNSNFWRLRGKLDVPKERFISYPGCERSADPTLVIGWAGWNHLQQAQAVAGYYVAMKESEGWSAERLAPLLAGLLELLPWLEQWHNDLDPAYGMGMGEYFRRFLDEELRSMDLTIDGVSAWKPSAATGKKRKGR